MTKRYDETSLSDELVVTPEEKANLDIPLKMMVASVKKQCIDIEEHFGVKITNISIDWRPGKTEVTISI